MNYYEVGKIINTQGLQGEVKVYTYTDFPEERFAKKSLLSLFDTKGNFVEELTVGRSRPAKSPIWIVKFKGYDSINQVERFRDYSLKVAEENLTELDEGEFYYHEIIGAEVFENDVKIGEVSEILQPGANDVWVIKRKGLKDLLIPYIPSVVLDVDIENNRINVEIPEGLD